MTRYVVFGGRPPPPRRAWSLLRVVNLFRRRREQLVRATHFQKSNVGTVSRRRSAAGLVVERGSRAGRDKTLHFSTSPRRHIEQGVLGVGTLVLVASVAYWAWNRDEVVFTARRRTMAFSWKFEKEHFGGERIDKNAERDDETLGPRLDAKEDIRARVVQEIALRVIQAAEEDFPDIKGKFEWRVFTRENPAVNAFCAPGGSLTVFTGLIDCIAQAETKGEISSSRDALAAVIAHECAHGWSRHGMEKLTWLPIQLPFLLFTPDVDVLWESFNVFFKLPHSRLCETEADRVGTNIMARAGFDPREAPKLFKVINKSGKLFEWNSTHPAGETRASDLQHLMEVDMALYEQNKHRFDSRNFEWPDILQDWVIREKEKERNREMLREGKNTKPMAYSELGNESSTTSDS